MKLAILFLIPLLGGCERRSGDDRVAGKPRRAIQTASLTGLYEASNGREPAGRMCFTPAPRGKSFFGIVTEKPGGASCGGSGDATFGLNNTVRLIMGGDQECVIKAKIDNGQITMPSLLSPTCSYYCAPGATLAKVVFQKTGGTTADAMRAKDLAGDPLCG